MEGYFYSKSIKIKAYLNVGMVCYHGTEEGEDRPKDKKPPEMNELEEGHENGDQAE